MSKQNFFSDESLIVVQRGKNQITIPNAITKKIGAKKNTKYRAKINKKGNIELELVLNDISKYARNVKTEKSAVQTIREEREKDDLTSLSSINFAK
jgi:hypothetical protein